MCTTPFDASLSAATTVAASLPGTTIETLAPAILTSSVPPLTVVIFSPSVRFAAKTAPATTCSW